MIYTLGETLCDLIFKDNHPEVIKPGGAMLNAAVSLSRAKVACSLISEYGLDELGDLIDSFLRENNVKREYVNRYEQHNTAVALAFLDTNKNATYRFYKDYPDSRLQISIPEFKKGDILLFGSFFALEVSVRSIVLQILEKAKSAGSLIIYDPNIRKKNKTLIPGFLNMIKENIHYADIVRASDEDFEIMMNIDNSRKAFQFVSGIGEGKILIYTMSDKGVDFYSNEYQINIEVDKIKVVSTIGAGDNFNAGLIYSMTNSALTKNEILHLSKEDWRKYIAIAIKFAANVCQRYDNYISQDFASSI